MNPSTHGTLTPNDVTIAQLRRLLDSREISAIELARSHLDIINDTSTLNAFITVNEEWTLKQAYHADTLLKRGEGRMLTGIPIAVKDIICAHGQPTTAGSEMLRRFYSPYDAFVVEQLRNCGAVMVGKTNLDEFAMGSTNTHSFFGPAHNVWRARSDPQTPLTPGGSSGGSAVAVASQAALVSLGTDTGGSVRAPASYCGIVGIKPTYGQCSRWGVIAYASSLDQVGTFGKNVTDAALALEAIWGHDSRDATSISGLRPALINPDSPLGYSSKIKGLRVGIVRQMLDVTVDDDIARTWQECRDWLSRHGADVRVVDIPTMGYAHAAYFVIATSECSSNLARYDGVRYGLRVDSSDQGDNVDSGDIRDMYVATRTKGFGTEVKWRILSGAFALSAGYVDAYYGKAQSARNQIRQEFLSAFKDVDTLLMPTTPTPAFPAGTGTQTALQESLNDVFLSPISLAGLPAASIPVGVNKDGLPIGMQLACAPLQERNLVSSALLLESLARENGVAVSLPRVSSCDGVSS